MNIYFKDFQVSVSTLEVEKSAANSRRTSKLLLDEVNGRTHALLILSQNINLCIKDFQLPLVSRMFQCSQLISHCRRACIQAGNLLTASQPALTTINGKGVYTSLWTRNPSVRSITCHMRSHSVTCHPTQVDVPRLNPSHPGRYSITYPGWMEG